MSGSLIDDKIAWHTAKIEQYKERIVYHEMQRHVLKRAKERAITINTISNTISANDSNVIIGDEL